MSFNRNMSLTGVFSTLLLSLLSSGCLSEADVWQRLNDADQDGVKACGADSNPLFCDCDDEDPNIYPAHGNVMAPPELCDGKDNDCNLTADDGLIFYTYYPDADADGVGSLDSNLDGSSDAKQSCQSTLEGYARSSDDCNDANAQTYPGSPFETCDRLDNIDYNCDGYTGKQDADGDRSPACEDCNDGNAEQWPGHLEVCDGVDNDCNGGIDDLTDKQTLYRDADTDGYGNAKVSKQFDRCEESGYVSNALDCDDTNALINPTAEELCDLQDNNCNGQTDEGLENKQLYADDDRDEYGNHNKPAQACTAPDGYVENDDDCNDRDPNSHPGAAESCTATVDSNCDGSVGDVDQDQDGIPACQDCNDADATVYPAYNGNPGATEKCDGIDQNCNGVDDDLNEEVTLFEDKDRDGFGNPFVQLRSKSCNVNGYVANANDCDDSRATVHPEADEVCDGLDSDCDGKIPSTEADADGDGVRSCSENSQPPDCNDGDNTVYPNASEGCDGLDNNCNELVDEGVQLPFYPDADQDGYGDGNVPPVDACEAPIGTVSNGSDCQDDDALIHPHVSERCDGVDNNCDGVIDEDLLLLTWPDADGDGFGDSLVEPEALCIRPDGTAGNDDDCDDSHSDINPLAAEVLNNGIDDNCNGEVDEAFSWLYPDLDGDGYGAGEVEYVETQSVGYSTLSTDCDDAHASMYPGAEEQCDTLDNDCDEQVDEGVESTFYRDADGDGFGLTSAAVSGCIAPTGTSTSAGDCDDNDEDTYPGAEESCDLADNDCDGVVDEEALDALPFYPDADQDGYGASGSVPLYACAAPVGQVDNDDDCNDRDDDVSPDGIEVCDGNDTDCDGNPDNGVSNAQTWHPDADKDGYGDLNRSLQSCSAPTVDNLSWILDGRDCHDANPTIHPGASETCNGIDDDCDGELDDGLSLDFFFRDADGDGFGDAKHWLKACVAPSGYVSMQGDCDDTNPNIYPGALEVCDNQDNDCDTQVDEGLLQTFYKDQDGDGYGDPQQSQLACPTPTGYVSRGGDCNDGNKQVYPSAPEECNGLDDNCNGQLDEGVSSTWYQDADQDGHGNPLVTKSACTRPDGYLASPADDCNDNNPTSYPGAVEVCDTVDNNCNGTTDEGVTTTYYRDVDGDGYGSASSTTQGCKVPSGYVTNKLDCQDTDANINPDAIEVCDGKDQDCNAQIDEGLPVSIYYRDADGDGYGNSAQSQSACKTPDGYVEVGGDCHDADKAIHPKASEVCNGKDDNCDGTTDEGLATQTWYKDGDGDGYGLSTSSQVACAQPTGYSAQSGDCVDTDKNTFPGAAEKESTTACMTDADGDGYGSKVPASGVAVGTDCVDTDKLINPTATESCNGKDDDCDGLVDAADPGTTCPEICEVGSGKTYTQISAALSPRVSPPCKEILVYPGSYQSFTIQKVGPLSIRSSAGAGQTIIDANKAGVGISIQNSSSVVVGNDVVVDGFTVKNGTGLSDPAGSGSLLGGGVYLGAGAAPTLKNLVVISSSATYGGGIYIDGTCSSCTQSPVLEDIIVGRTGEGNVATVEGGGLYVKNVPTTRPLKIKGDFLKVEANRINAWPSAYGGGMRVVASALEVTAKSWELRSNQATNQSCCSNGLQGGGLYVNNSSVIRLLGVDFQVIGNYAQGSFGGIFLDASSLTMDSASSGLIQSNSTYAYEAGGLGVWNNSTVTLNGLKFDKNSAGTLGGAIRIYNSPGVQTVSGCTFTGNKSGQNGGAIYTDGNVTVKDSTFEGNTATNGGSGGAIYAGGAVTASRVLIGQNQATQSSGSTSPTCAGIHMAGGSIKEALFWGNKAVNGRGGILCVEGSGAVVDSVIFSGNQVSSGQANAGSLLLTGSGHKVQNVTIAYTENLLKTGNMAEISNTSTGLNLLNNVLVADSGDYYLDFGLSSTSTVTNASANVLYFYGVSGCTGNTGGCGDENTSPVFVASDDDNNICDEDYHLSSSDNPTLPSNYGAFGINTSWDDSLPAIPECP